MRITTFIITASLAVSAFATNPSAETPRTAEQPSAVALEVPGTQYRGIPDPTFPERSEADPSTWDDTADTSDELRTDTESRDEAPEIKPEKDLNNQVHDPLLESPLEGPTQQPAEPRENNSHDPVIDPIP